MSLPTVTHVAPGSPAESAGLQAGDEVLRLNGQVPRDIIEWRVLVDEPEVAMDVRRGNDFFITNMRQLLRQLPNRGSRRRVGARHA